jgi:RNA polymerase sigma factor (TIGR02999 family)
LTEVTRILTAIDQGDPHAAEQLLPLVYGELRKLAAQKLTQEKPGHATALVHEAYLRLVTSEDALASPAGQWNSRGHFFGAAAEAMRRILVDRARETCCGGELPCVDSGLISQAQLPGRLWLWQVPFATTDFK